MSAALARFGTRLALVVCTALVIRVTYLLTSGEDVLGLGDFYFYHWSANLLADGRGFTDPFLLTSFGVELPTAEHPPLWSMLLSLVSVLGGSGSPVGVMRPEGVYLSQRLVFRESRRKVELSFISRVDVGEEVV